MAVQINVAANQAALTASIQAGVQAYNQRFAQNNTINLGINQRGFSQPLGRITGDVKDFEAALAASNARVIAFGASTAVLGGVIRSFKELANVTIEVEKNLADINRVFGLTTSQLQKFSTDLFNVTKQTASSFDDASKAALEFSRQGLKAEETLQRTKDALTLTRLAGISTANAVDALTSTINGFSATGVTTTQILNKLVAVEQDFAVGAGDLAEALSRTGQAAQEAGVSLDQLNALVTSAQQSTARGGAVIGNALKTIFTRLQRTETLDQLEAFNISVRDIQGNILPAVTILQNFAGAYKNLADAQRAQLSEQVAGVYQVNILKAIVNDLNKSQGVYAGALQRGASATNEAEIATAKLNKTLDALLSQTATSAQQLANNIGKVTFEPLARYGTEQLKSLIENMNEILEGEGIGSTFANGLLKGIRNVIAGPGAIAAFFTLFKLIQNSFTYLSQALPQIAGITTETQNRKNIEQSILQIMAQQGPISQALAGTMGNQAAQAQLLLQLARQQTAEYQTQTTLAKQLAAQLANQGVRVKGSGGLQVTRAGGYIPNATKMAEVVGAQAGGYAPGRVVSSPVGGVMNTAEDVRYIPGFAQPFINPPAGSKAGRAHRQNAINRTGVDPYMASGFIPNFAITGLASKDFDKEGGGEYKILAGRIFESLLRGDSFVSLTENKVAADIDVGKYAIREAKLSGKSAYNDHHFGYGKLKGSNLILPKTATKDYDDRLKQNKKANIFRAPYTHAFLFAKAKEIIDREKLNNKTNLSKIYLSNGFIPNFGLPLSTARIPWFKKYSSKYKNTAGDTDLFKMGDFPTYGRGLDHVYAKSGNASMLSYLHEDFVKSAINIALGSKKIIRPAEAGFKDKPVSEISNENDFDLLYRIADGSYSMLELKQDFKNISGSVTGFMTKKLENLKKENPVLAKKVSSMIAVSNMPKFIDPTGKNPAGQFSEFETAIAAIVKDKYSNVDPTISTKLTKVTDGLLKRYEAKKNTNHAGFIPNFASMISSSIKGKGNISATKTGKNNYEIEGVEVGKKFRGQGLGSQLYGRVVEKIGAGNTVKSVLLPQEQALADYASGKSISAKAIFPQLSWAKMAKSSKLLVNGKEIAISDFESGIASHKYNAAKLDMALIELINSHASGFIPNFAYKQAVMGLEEGMSGNKAIFDTKPFPHIRNSSQPTFSSAIADHGGLSNALSDSMRGQKAAGLMSGGFLPNFAPRPYRYSGRGSVVDPSGGVSLYSAGLGFSLADQERRARGEFNRIINALRTGAMTAQQAIDAFNTLNTQAGLSARAQTNLTRILNREVAAAGTTATGASATGGSLFKRISSGLSKAGTAISIAGPTIAGLAEQSIFGNRKRTEMSSTERMAQSFSSTGLSAITTGVGIGAQAGGLPGAVIGGAVGGLIALKTSLDSASLSIDELKDKKEEEKSKIAENISSAEKYVAIQEEISKSTSPKDIKKNLISLRTELSSIKDADFANKIKLAGTDITSLSSIVQEYSLKQKEATSVLNDAILIQKKYSFETLKSAGLLKIKEEGGTGQAAKFMKFASGSVDSMLQFLGIGGVKERELSKIDLSDKKTRETIYKENPGFFKSFSKVNRDVLVDISREYSSEVESSFGLGEFRTGKLTELLKKGGLQGNELETIVATLKEAGTSGSYLGTALADGFVLAVSKFDQYQNSQEKQLEALGTAAEAVANLNQQLKDFVNNLEYSFKDLNRQNEFEKKLRNTRSANTMLLSESLYGKASSLQTQYDFDIQDIESETKTKELDLSKKLLTTNIQDYYNLSDAQKTAYIELSKSFDLSNPEQNLKKIEGFVQTQFGTLDIGKATDKQKEYLQKISDVRKDISQIEKGTADDLAIAAEKFKEALVAMELSRDFVFQFKSGFRDLATEGDQLVGTIGRQLPKMFADGLVDGIKAAVKESDNLGQALMGIASKFLDEISTMMLRSGIYKLVGAFAPSLLQGSISVGPVTPAGKQKGGVIRAQSGMYISGTGSGDKYPALLENGEYVLNRNAVMAMGGPAALDTLNFSSAPRFASGGSFNTELSDIKAMEEGMTTFGLENSSLYKELRDAEIQRAEQARQKKRARQAQTAQMVGSLVASVATIGIGAGISNKMGNIQAGKAQNLSAKLQTGQPLTNAESMSIRGFMNKGLISPTGVYKGPDIVRTGFSGFTGYNRQTGGSIGSRLSDTIPGYMEGGLYNSPMVKKYGTGMQGGGMSSVANNSNTVNNNNASNSFNFNTSVNRDGTIQIGADSSTYKQQDVELSNNLNSKIYGAVLDVIREQQRFGGSLAGTRKA